jgi:hypothetical protein
MAWLDVSHEHWIAGGEHCDRYYFYEEMDLGDWKTARFFDKATNRTMEDTLKWM